MSSQAREAPPVAHLGLQDQAAQAFDAPVDGQGATAEAKGSTSK